MKALSSVNYAQALKIAGLHRRGFGLTTVRELSQLASEPQPMIRRPTVGTYRDTINTKPCELTQIGPLIREGFAKLDKDTELYRITPEGQAWLEQVKEAFLA